VDGEKACPSRETGCGGQRPQVEACSKHIPNYLYPILKRKDLKDESSQFYILFRGDMELESPPPTVKGGLRVMMKRVLSATLGVKEEVRREI